MNNPCIIIIINILDYNTIQIFEELLNIPTFLDGNNVVSVWGWGAVLSDGTNDVSVLGEGAALTGGMSDVSVLGGEAFGATGDREAEDTDLK